MSRIRDLKHHTKDTAKYALNMEDLSMKLKESYIQLGIPNHTVENLTKERTLEAIIKNTSCKTAKLVLRGGNFQDIADVLNKFVRACQDEEIEQTQSSNVFYTNRHSQGSRNNLNNNYWGNNHNNYFRPNRQDERQRGRSQERRFQSRTTNYSPSRNSNYRQNNNSNPGNGQGLQQGRWRSYNQDQNHRTSRSGSFSRNQNRN